MKPIPVVILIGLGALIGLVLAGWHLGSPTPKKPSPQKPSPATAATPLRVQTESQPDTLAQPFEVPEAAPYGPAIAPEEMKPLPSPTEASVHLETPIPSAKAPEKP